MTIESARANFPSLRRMHNGKPVIFLDGPAGTQVPLNVINAIVEYYSSSNANTHGAFITTRETDLTIQGMREAMAAFLGAVSADTISIGQNMTTLNFALARAMSRVLKPGDEVLITQLDHEANRGPWLTLTASGISVNEVRLLPNGLLDYDDFAARITPRTKLVCMGMSSNSIGTVNDFGLVRRLTKKQNAWLLLDAVHYAPHFSIDVQSLDCDFLLCSAYKFYGPHVGILYTRPGLMEKLPLDTLRTQDQMAPYLIETGTLNHAAIAGVKAAVEFLAELGQGSSLREKLVSAFQSIATHEHLLASRLYAGLKDLKGVTVIGQDFRSRSRTPTVSFTVDGTDPIKVCEYLAGENIFAWDGNFYAIRPIEVLGLLEKGGVTRMGVSLYNTVAEIDTVLEAMRRFTRQTGQ